MDVDWFRLQLKALEDDKEGMPWTKTHIHNTEVVVAGTTFSRTVEIIAPYSVQFTPDSQWSVRLTGANNNIFDVENGILVQNQVQVIAQNSGGLVATLTAGDVLGSQIVESYADKGVSPTLAQAVMMILQGLSDFSFSGVTKTVKGVDGVSTAATFTLDDAQSPTSLTRET